MKLENYFVKYCTNEFLSKEWDFETDCFKVARYRREDLDNWAKEAYDKGETYFYAEPVDPDKPFGKLQLCEPKYKYRLKECLTEEDFQRLNDIMELGIEYEKIIDKLNSIPLN